MRNVILVDLDHTLFDASWRDHLIPRAIETNEWDEYHDTGIHDKLCTDTLNLLDSLSHYMKVAVTARPSKWRNQTLCQFDMHKIFFHDLLMRDQVDFAPSPELKLNLARRRFGPNFAERILFIIDDRADVCEAFSKEGVSSLQIRGRSYG